MKAVEFGFSGLYRFLISLYLLLLIPELPSGANVLAHVVCIDYAHYDQKDHGRQEILVEKHLPRAV